MKAYVVAGFTTEFDFPIPNNSVTFYLRDNGEGKLDVSWPYGCQDFDYLRSRAKRLKAVWDGEFWVFPEVEGSDNFFDFSGKKRYLRYGPRIHKGDEFVNCEITLHTVANGAYVLSNEASLAAKFKDNYWVQVGTKCRWWENAPIVHENAEVLLQRLECEGASVKVTCAAVSPVKIEVDRWLVRIKCKPDSDPAHFLIRMKEGPLWHWDAPYPYGERISVPWDGVITTTRSEWKTKWEKVLQKLGIKWEGDNPEKTPIHNKIAFKWESIPGWTYPSPNGNFLHPFQREGIEFIASLSGRALIGDEMGTGKTAQAIASANGLNAERVVVVVPASARFVWDREIRGWAGGNERIQHITSGDQGIDSTVRWIIVTYDLLITRPKRLSVDCVEDRQAISRSLKNAGISSPDWNKSKGKDKKPKWSAQIENIVDVDGLTGETKQKWNKLKKQLKTSTLNNILDWSPDLLIADEAHRVKNAQSKRTKAVFELSEITKYQLLLTGTPIRNHAGEAGTLLSLLDEQARGQVEHLSEVKYKISEKRKMRERLVRDFLSTLMIRRTKKDVLNQLPPKIREWIEVHPSINHSDVMTSLEDYEKAICVAEYAYSKAILSGKSEGEAQNAMRGGIEKARTAMGIMKVVDGQIAKAISSVVESKGYCIVFSAHRAVTDLLADQLSDNGCSVVVVDGRTPPIDRAEAERAFQAGEVEVFLGGINSAGESITLTRADTCAFIESDWVPAAMMQAEDRGHRIGQEGNGYHIMHFILSEETGVTLDSEMKLILEEKIQTINRLLDENTDFDFSTGKSQGSIQSRVLNAILQKRKKNKEDNEEED